MASRWPRAQAPLTPKFGPGDVVKKSSGGPIRFTDRVGVETGSAGGIGSVLICYVVKSHNHEYLVQVIPNFELQGGAGLMYKGAFGFVEAKHLSQGKRERSMSGEKVYDGEKFHEDRMKAARRKAGKQEGKGYVDR